MRGTQTLRDYTHRYNPKKFTQAQLFAYLMLKEFLRLDYRKLEALLNDTPNLCSTIGLQVVPHFTTFQKAAKRLLENRFAKRLMAETVSLGIAGKRDKTSPRILAVDGTGFESRHVSSYFMKRVQTANSPEYTARKRCSGHPKAGVLCDSSTHLILSVVPARGPSSDIKYLRRLLVNMPESIRIGTLLADAGYDGEWVHEFVRSELGGRTIIPPKIGRPTTKPPSGHWRRVMKQRFGLMKKKYGKRWQVETVNSMIKRLLGSAMRARYYWSQCREIILRAITLNVMILRQT